MLCLDEMGPVSAKTYPTERWSMVGHLPKVEADYGRRAKLWVFGAFEPHTGKAFTGCALRRRSCDFVAFLEQLLGTWPQGELFLILDNLSIHRSLEVRLWAVTNPRARFLFQPTYAPWLNLIEPWWKTLRSLALKGFRFEGTEDIITAIRKATFYWNDHCHPYRWRKSFA